MDLNEFRRRCRLNTIVHPLDLLILAVVILATRDKQNIEDGRLSVLAWVAVVLIVRGIIGFFSQRQ